MFGIKYIMSGANEKANLKGMLPKYLIGIFAITCCFIIAQAVAKVAGNDDAEKVIALGEKYGITFVDTVKPQEDKSDDTTESENLLDKYEPLDILANQYLSAYNNSKVYAKTACPVTSNGKHSWMHNKSTENIFEAECAFCNETLDLLKYKESVTTEDTKPSVIPEEVTEKFEIRQASSAPSYSEQVAEVMQGLHKEELGATSINIVYKNEDKGKIKKIEYLDEDGNVVATDTFTYVPTTGRVADITHKPVEGSNKYYSFNYSFEGHGTMNLNNQESVRIFYDGDENIKGVTHFVVGEAQKGIIYE